MNIVILVTGKTSLSQVWLTVEETITGPVPGNIYTGSTRFERFFSSNDFRDRRDRRDKVRVFKVCKTGGGWQVANAYTPREPARCPFIPTLFDLARFLRDLWLRDLKMERQTQKSI